MKKTDLILLVVVGGVSLAGCGGSLMGARNMKTVRARDTLAVGQYRGVRSFTTEEFPTVVVQHYGGNYITVRLCDEVSGEEVDKRSTYVSYGEDAWVQFPYLPVGEYEAKLEVDGEVKESCRFTVRD